MKICRLYISTPDQPFDRALVSEAEQVASELTRNGFPIRVEAHHARLEAPTSYPPLEKLKPA